MNCIKCGKEHNDYHFRVLHVETLHVRDFKEKRIQALGDFEEYDVCGDCARAKYDSHMADLRDRAKELIPFLLMIVAGAVIAVLLRNELPLMVFGVGMVACGMGCFGGRVRAAAEKMRELSALSEEQALYRCAWECLLESAPKKNDVNDITYIPVDAETLARKNGDLMILYDLLPEIAIAAHKRIHGIETE